MYSTKPLTPPEYAKFSVLPSRWSINSIFVPLLRNESSRMRLARMSKWYSMLLNVSDEAMKCTSVPRRSLGATTASGATGTPRRNSIWCNLPSRQILSFSQLDSALTTDTPTPCRPPATL